MANLYLHQGIAKDLSDGKRVHLVTGSAISARANVLSVVDHMSDQQIARVTHSAGDESITHVSGGKLTASSIRSRTALRGIDADRIVFHDSTGWSASLLQSAYNDAQAACQAKGGDIIHG